MKQRNIGDELIEGLKNAIEYAKGDKTKGKETIIYVPVIDVKRIRKKQGMTQARFAQVYGFKLDAIKNWEQGRRRPERSAQILLEIIDREPEFIRTTIKAIDQEDREV